MCVCAGAVESSTEPLLGKRGRGCSRKDEHRGSARTEFFSRLVQVRTNILISFSEAILCREKLSLTAGSDPGEL